MNIEDTLYQGDRCNLLKLNITSPDEEDNTAFKIINDIITINIESLIFWDSDYSFQDLLENNNPMKLCISFLGIYDSNSIIPLARQLANIPQAAQNGMFSFDEQFNIPTPIKNLNKVVIELSCTRKGLKEMGIEESVRVGTFFRTILNINHGDSYE